MTEKQTLFPMARVPRKERWLDIVKKSDCKTSGAMGQDGILGSHSLVISVRTGRCCLYPQNPSLSGFP